MFVYQFYDLAKVLRAQWISPERLAKLQGLKLNRLVRHAYRHVPYFREMFDRQGIKPREIADLGHLQRLPLMDKKFFQELRPEERNADIIPAHKCRNIRTSGTTGLALQFNMTNRDITLRNFNSARAYLAAGYKPWEKMAVLAGSRRANEKKSWNERLGLWRRREISSWKSPAQWLADLAGWKPHVLTGRASTLLILAEEAQKVLPSAPRPRLVFSSAEVLDDKSRRTLRAVFNCPVIDFYFSFEGGCLGWECRKCGAYHVNSDMVIVEVLKDGRPALPGEEGEVVITNLHSFATPLIRYRQGDVVVLSRKNPRCGRGLPLLERIQGREIDHLVLKSGRKIPPANVYFAFMDVPGVQRWQVVQNAPDRIRILIEPNEGYDPAARQFLRREMRDLLQEDVDLEIIEVTSIEQRAGEKPRHIISELHKLE